MTAILGSLYIYPVKSAAGIECERVQLGPHGLLHDREWLIVDENGRFLTQREESRLALLATAISGDSLRLTLPSGASMNEYCDSPGSSSETSLVQIVFRNK